MRSNPRPYENEWPKTKRRFHFDPVAGKRKLSKVENLFRTPPKPYAEGCPMCGLPRFALGWHYDWNGSGETPPGRGHWHKACAAAFRLMTAPRDFEMFFRRRQGNRCSLSGVLLGETVDIDHMIPLYRVYRDFGHLDPDELVGFWGPANLRAVDPVAHKEKCAFEARERSSYAG